jgi:hypothetical protein
VKENCLSHGAEKFSPWENKKYGLFGSLAKLCVEIWKKTRKTPPCALLYEHHSKLPLQVLFEQARQPLFRHLRTAYGSVAQGSKNIAVA